MVLAVFFLPVVRRFAIIEKNTGKILFTCDVKPEDTFSVIYTHSVNKSPVEDVFVIQPDYGIMVKKSVYYSFGAGIPYELEAGQELHVYDDRIEIDNINRDLQEYLLFVGTVADHTFVMKNHRIHLNQLTQPQQTVSFQVCRVPLIHLMKGE